MWLEGMKLSTRVLETGTRLQTHSVMWQEEVKLTLKQTLCHAIIKMLSQCTGFWNSFPPFAEMNTECWSEILTKHIILLALSGWPSVQMSATRPDFTYARTPSFHIRICIHIHMPYEVHDCVCLNPYICLWQQEFSYLISPDSPLLS